MYRWLCILLWHGVISQIMIYPYLVDEQDEDGPAFNNLNNTNQDRSNVTNNSSDELPTTTYFHNLNNSKLNSDSQELSGEYSSINSINSTSTYNETATSKNLEKVQSESNHINNKKANLDIKHEPNIRDVKSKKIQKRNISKSISFNNNTKKPFKIKKYAKDNITALSHHHYDDTQSKQNNYLKLSALVQERGVKKDILENTDPVKYTNESISYFDGHGPYLTDDIIKEKVAHAKNIMELRYPQHNLPEQFITESIGIEDTSSKRNITIVGSSKDKIEIANGTSTSNETSSGIADIIIRNVTAGNDLAQPDLQLDTTTPMPPTLPVNTTISPTTPQPQPTVKQAPVPLAVRKIEPQDYGNIFVSGPKNITEPVSQRDEVETDRFATLTDALQKDVLTSWVYRDYIKSPADLMLDQGLINRAKISTSSGDRLRTIFEKALTGHNVNAALITSAVTRAFANDPASQKWLYPNALLDWWRKTVTPSTNSSISYKDVSLAGVGSDYFSRCLKNHLPDNSNSGVNLILWELSGSDYKSHGKLRPIDAQSLERFLRNTLEYHSNPDLIILNFFRGNNMNRSAYCRELDEESESKLAKHYDCTALSWSKSVCPYLTDDEEGFSFSYLFSRDKIHPSIIGHAQMAYILIDYIRDEFLNFLREPKPVTRSFPLPKAIFSQVFKPLCFTTLNQQNKTTIQQGDTDPELPVIFISPDSREEAIHRSKISNFSNSIIPIIMRFTISDDEVNSYRTIGLLPSFTKPLRTVMRLDNKPFVNLQVTEYQPGELIEIKPSVKLSKGPHMLRVWSLDKRFKVLALTLDTEHSSICKVLDDSGCW